MEEEREDTRGELVDNVVGRPVKHHLSEIIHVRRCLLDHNESYVQIVRDIRSLRWRKAILGRSIDLLEQQREGHVWVPPSSVGGTSTHHSNAKKNHARNKEEVEKAKAEHRALSRELCGLAVKRAFFVWRMMSVLYREMEAMLSSIEKYTNMDLVRESFKGWKTVAQPWAYDETVLEHMEIFRCVCDLGQLDRIFLSWRRWMYYSRDLEERRDMFVWKRDVGLLKDAVAQWKVYRVMHHLNVMQRHMAVAYDSLRLRKKVFSHWMNRVRRRLVLQERMEMSVFNDGRQQRHPCTVDDLLLLGTVPGCSNDFGRLHNIRDDVVHLKKASDLMRQRVRWNNLHGVVFKGKQPLLGHEIPSMECGVPEDAISDKICVCEGEIVRLRQEEQNVRECIHALYRNVSRCTRKHKAAVQNLVEYENTASELEQVKTKLERQYATMAEVARVREGEYLEKVEHANHLEEVHQSMYDALQKAKAGVISHATSIDKAYDDVREWKTKVRQHSRSAMARGSVEHSITVKLEESRTRLQKAERRLEKLNTLQDEVRTVQSKASTSERQAWLELEDARKACGHAHAVHEQSQNMVESIHAKLVALEHDYECVMPYIDRIVMQIDELSDAIKKTNEEISQQEATCDSIAAEIQTHEMTIKSLEAERCQRLKETSLKDVSHPMTLEEYTEEESIDTISVLLSSGPVSKQRYRIPGDWILLQSARSYAILKRAKSYFLRWKNHVDTICDISKNVDALYSARYIPDMFANWRHGIITQKRVAEDVYRGRMLSLVLTSWKGLVESKRRELYLIQSYQALDSVKMKQRVLSAWRDAVYVEQAGSDAECRLMNKKVCSMFHFWRNTTSHSMALKTRYLEFCQGQEETLKKELFHEWKSATRHRRLLCRVFDRACQAWSLRLAEDRYFADVPRVLHECMSFWSMHVHISREDRHLEKIGLHVQHVRSRDLLKTVIKSWKRITVERAACRADIIDTRTSKQNRDILQCCFDYMRSSANQRITRTLSLRVTWTCDHPRRLALDAWKHAVEKAKHQKMIDERCLKLRHALLVSKDNEKGHIQAVRDHMYTILSPPKRIMDPSHQVPSPGDVSAISV